MGWWWCAGILCVLHMERVVCASCCCKQPCCMYTDLPPGTRSPAAVADATAMHTTWHPSHPMHQPSATLCICAHLQGPQHVHLQQPERGGHRPAGQAGVPHQLKRLVSLDVRLRLTLLRLDQLGGLGKELRRGGVAERVYVQMLLSRCSHACCSLMLHSQTGRRELACITCSGAVVQHPTQHAVGACQAAPVASPTPKPTSCHEVGCFIQAVITQACKLPPAAVGPTSVMTLRSSCSDLPGRRRLLMRVTSSASSFTRALISRMAS
jgi:hypothetical protein